MATPVEPGTVDDQALVCLNERHGPVVHGAVDDVAALETNVRPEGSVEIVSTDVWIIRYHLRYLQLATNIGRGVC